MGQQNGFSGGFIVGSIIGGVVGGLLGTILAARNEKQLAQLGDREGTTEREFSFGTEESIELARHGLEDKIAQLNLAIDDVRQQLGTVQANTSDNE